MNPKIISKFTRTLKGVKDSKNIILLVHSGGIDYYKPEELRKELLVQFKIDIKSVNSIESIIRESEFIFKTYSNYFINGSKLALLVFKDRYNTIYIGKKIEIKVYSGKKCLHTEENNLNIHDIEPISRTQLPLIKKPINNLDLLDGESIIV